MILTAQAYPRRLSGHFRWQQDARPSVQDVGRRSFQGKAWAGKSPSGLLRSMSGNAVLWWSCADELLQTVAVAEVFEFLARSLESGVVLAA